MIQYFGLIAGSTPLGVAFRILVSGGAAARRGLKSTARRAFGQISSPVALSLAACLHKSPYPTCATGWLPACIR
jgi:hypothetical protein